MFDKKEIKQASSICIFPQYNCIFFFFNIAIPDAVSHRAQVRLPLLPPDVFCGSRSHRSVH